MVYRKYCMWCILFSFFPLQCFLKGYASKNCISVLYFQFIHLGQTLKYYGYIKFDPCITDFPEKGCQVIVSAGNNELNFHVKLPNEQMKEGSFKVTRMRCWRVTSSVSETSVFMCCRWGWMNLPFSTDMIFNRANWLGDKSCSSLTSLTAVPQVNVSWLPFFPLTKCADLCTIDYPNVSPTQG